MPGLRVAAAPSLRGLRAGRLLRRRDPRWDQGAGREATAGTGKRRLGAAERPPCPASPPGDGSACGLQGRTCEWGSSPVQDCDTVALCNGGRWQVTPHDPGGLDCGGGPPATCPPSYGDVPRAAHCSPAIRLVLRLLPTGRCAGTVLPAGPGFPLPTRRPWPSGCARTRSPAAPRPRPLLGSTCDQDGLAVRTTERAASLERKRRDVPGGPVDRRRRRVSRRRGTVSRRGSRIPHRERRRKRSFELADHPISPPLLPSLSYPLRAKPPSCGSRRRCRRRRWRRRRGRRASLRSSVPKAPLGARPRACGPSRTRKTSCNFRDGASMT